MKFKVIGLPPLPPNPTFESLPNGEVFMFVGEESSGVLFMKVEHLAMRLSNTKEVIKVVPSTIVEHFDSQLIVQGKFYDKDMVDQS